MSCEAGRVRCSALANGRLHSHAVCIVYEYTGSIMRTHAHTHTVTTLVNDQSQEVASVERRMEWRAWDAWLLAAARAHTTSGERGR